MEFPRCRRIRAGVLRVVLLGLAAAALVAPGSGNAAPAPKAIQITKTADSSIVDAGGQIGYTISVTNLSKPPASDVLVTDTLPTNSGTSWSIDSAPPGACASSSGVLSCSVSRVADAFSVHIVSPTTSATCGTVSNTASVTTKKSGSAISPTANITVNCPDLTIMSVVFASSGSSCTVTVKNVGTGTADLSNVVVQAYYEPDTSYDDVNGTPAGGTSFSQPSLAPGASVDLTLCSGSPGAGDNYVVVKVDATDQLAESDENNNVASAPIPGPDLTITSIAFASSGSSCTVTVKNVGTDTADLSNVVVQAYYEPDSTYDPVNGNAAGGTSFTQPSLAPGASVDLTLCSGSPGAGDNYVVAKVDATDQLAESNENNNVDSAPIP